MQIKKRKTNEPFRAIDLSPASHGETTPYIVGIIQGDETTELIFNGLNEVMEVKSILDDYIQRNKGTVPVPKKTNTVPSVVDVVADMVPEKPRNVKQINPFIPDPISTYDEDIDRLVDEEPYDEDADMDDYDPYTNSEDDNESDIIDIANTDQDVLDDNTNVSGEEDDMNEEAFDAMNLLNNLGLGNK